MHSTAAVAAVSALLAVTACSADAPARPGPSASTPTVATSSPLAGLSQDQLDRRLLRAATDDEVEEARSLVAAGADPDTLDDRHDTAWLITGVTGSVEMARVLLTADPDLTIRNRFGGVSHIPASERGHAAYVEFVLDSTDIDVDHVNDLGWTALLEAVMLGEGTERWQRIVQSLVDHGADVSIADRDGVTALQHARNRGFGAIADILEQA